MVRHNRKGDVMVLVQYSSNNCSRADLDAALAKLKTFFLEQKDKVHTHTLTHPPRHTHSSSSRWTRKIPKPTLSPNIPKPTLSLNLDTALAELKSPSVLEQKGQDYLFYLSPSLYLMYNVYIRVHIHYIYIYVLNPKP